MNETITTKDYNGVDRRAPSEGTPSIVYRNFPGIALEGMDLRAMQAAQRIIPALKISLAAKIERAQSEGREAFPILRTDIHNEWGKIATTENGFREGDENFDAQNPFHERVLHHTTEMLLSDMGIRTAQPGMPHSTIEEQQTNHIKELIRKKILRKVRAYERAHLGRTMKEKLLQKMMAALTSMDENRTTDAETEALRTEITAAGIDEKTLGGLIGICATFFREGTDRLLAKLKEEEELKETGQIDETTLDRSRVARWLFGFPAKNFIAGDTLQDVFENKFVQEILAADIGITVAHEIEATFDHAQADKNCESFKECARTLGKETERPGKKQKKCMSMKLSALGFYDQNPDATDTLPEPRTAEVKAYLKEILAEAMEHNVFVRIDMEYFIHKDATFKIFTELLEETPAYADHLGMVFQCYLKDSPQDAEEMIAWAKRFHAKHRKKVSLRVVKGANMEADERHAKKGLHAQIQDKTWHRKRRRALDLEGKEKWEPGKTPLANNRTATQKQFIEIMKAFEQNTDCLQVAYGTHNVDSIAHIIQTWMNNGQVPSERQIQTLLGMYNPLRFALTEFVQQTGYVPFGILGKILAYMARRFKELKKAEGGKKMPVMHHDNGLKETEKIAVAA